MDPLTHGILGGIIAQAVQPKKAEPYLAVSGGLAAMVPDLDLLIRSKHDPLLILEFHRHFSHSIIFAPVGGLLAALFLWLIWRRRHSFWKIYFAATLGFLSHGLLDACTSYGTVLLWPFSDQRFSWDIISIIDPVYSLILFIGLVWTLKTHWPKAARIALCLSFFYLGFGMYQHHRGMLLQERLAETRGHAPQHRRLMPTLGNPYLWRSLYADRGSWYTDAIWVNPLGRNLIWQGNHLPKFDSTQLKPPPSPESTLDKDIQRFAWFSEESLATLSTDPWKLGDMRYSAVPNGVTPFWGIQFDPHNSESHVERLRFPFRTGRNFGEFLKMLARSMPGAMEI